MTNILIAFFIGVIWQIAIGIQTKLLVSKSDWYYLSLWSTITSLLYCYLIKTVALGTDVFIPYALGTGLGVTFSRTLADKIINFFNKSKQITQ